MIRFFFAAIALALLLVTGVDLVYARSGLALLLLGCALLIFSVVSYRESRSPAPIFLIGLVGASGYFLIRGSLGGSPALFVSDGVLVLCGVSTFLIGRLLNLPQMKALLIVIVLVGFANVLWGFALNILEKESGSHTLTGFFGHYNLFTGFSNVTFFGALSLALLGFKENRWRAIFGIIALVCLGAIFSSGSRGGWVAFLLGGGVFCGLSLVRLNRSESRFFGPLLIVLILALVGGGVTLRGKMDAIIDERTDVQMEGFTDGGRLVYQQWGVDFFLNEPVVGNGPRSFEALSIKHWNLDELPCNFPNPDFVHNEFIQLLCDYGIVGFIIVMGILFICGVKGVAAFFIRSEQADEIKDGLLIFTLAATACLLGQALFSFLFHTPTLIALLGLLLAFLLGEKQGASRSLLSSALIAGVGGILIFCGGALAGSFYFYTESRDLFGPTPEVAQQQIDDRMRASALAFDSEMAENLGIRLHDFSLISAREDNPLAMKSFQKQSLEAFTLAEKLNPYSVIALCSKARLLDEMGDFEEAYPFHLRAVEEAKSREFFLRPCFFAARNRVYLGVQAFKDGNQAEGEMLFRQASDYLQQRSGLIWSYDPEPDSRTLFSSVRAWLSYFEAQRLYREGDRLWKKRDVEPGMALMLEAQKRYLNSKKWVQSHDPLWAIQVKQLQENLMILRGAAIIPAKIPEAEIERIAKGLESPAEKQ